MKCPLLTYCALGKMILKKQKIFFLNLKIEKENNNSKRKTKDKHMNINMDLNILYK